MRNGRAGLLAAPLLLLALDGCATVGTPRANVCDYDKRSVRQRWGREPDVQTEGENVAMWSYHQTSGGATMTHTYTFVGSSAVYAAPCRFTESTTTRR